MRLITIAGPPSSGKTSVILQAIECLKRDGLKAGVIKFDCLTSFDQIRYDEKEIPNHVGYSGKICPDHFYVANIDEAVRWGVRKGLDVMITESAGLCNRCAPYIEGITSVCVIDNLAGINTPKKLGPMLRFADVVVVTKGDIVSQAERDVFAYNIRQMNPFADVLFVNGITGQGAFLLARVMKAASEVTTVTNRMLKFTMPASVCFYCTGVQSIKNHHQSYPAPVRNIDFGGE